MTDPDRDAIVDALRAATRGKSRHELSALLRDFSRAARQHGIDPVPLMASAASREVFGLEDQNQEQDDDDQGNESTADNHRVPPF